MTVLQAWEIYKMFWNTRYDGGLLFKMKSWLFMFQSNPDGANNNEDSTLAPGIIWQNY